MWHATCGSCTANSITELLRQITKLSQIEDSLTSWPQQILQQLQLHHPQKAAPRGEGGSLSMAMVLDWMKQRSLSDWMKKKEFVEQNNDSTWQSSLMESNKDCQIVSFLFNESWRDPSKLLCYQPPST
jgi:hypothetical protein